MQDIYSRVAELVDAGKHNMKMAELFQSRVYADFIKKKAASIISGTFYTLRQAGFSASVAQENKLLSSLEIKLMHDPKSDVTAYAQDDGQYGRHLIVINTACDFVSQQGSREAQHLSVLGLLYHEIGHQLFTDYPTARAWSFQLERGRWFPSEPERINTVDGINLAQNMQDKDYRRILQSCGHSVANCLEDGYIEREVNLMCPGTGKRAIETMNEVLWDGVDYLQDDDPANPRPHQPGQEFGDLLQQILLYCEFGEIRVSEDYTGPLLDTVYECCEIIDECRFERDPQKRQKGVNELLCVLGPFIDKAVEEQKQHDQQNQQNQQGQQGQQGQSGQGQGSAGNQNQAGSQNGSGMQSAANALQQLISSVEQAVGASSKNENCTSQAINNPSDVKNAGAAATQDSAQSPGKPGKGVAGNNAGSLDAAVRSELNNLADAFTRGQACATAESERTAELNREGKHMDCSQYGLSSNLSVNVTRAADVSDTNVRAYEQVEGEIRAISRGLQRDIKRILKDRRESGKRKNLPFGRRLEVSSIVHDDAKYFSRNKLPTETPRLGVGILVDQSGSTGGELINAAMTASLVVEDFCRELDIPHLIYGYTSGRDAAQIFSYAEPQEIDNGNRYRITGMAATGGTPTAAAMAYMSKRMMSLAADVRLLIVITDGQAFDDAMNSDGERVIAKMTRLLRKDNVIVVAAGIGSDREAVENQFGGSFMDITDINRMPEQLVELIKRNLVV